MKNEVENGIRDLLTALDKSRDRITALEVDNKRLREALKYCGKTYGADDARLIHGDQNIRDKCRAALTASQVQDK